MCQVDRRILLTESGRMDGDDTPSVLAVGARLANLSRARSVGDVAPADMSLAEVSTSREALNLLRAMPFDLVALGDEIGDATSVEFAQRLHRAKPWQKWLLVTDQGLNADEEVTLRSLGALAILDGPDAWREVLAIARKLRRSRPETTIPGFILESIVK